MLNAKVFSIFSMRLVKPRFCSIAPATGSNVHRTGSIISTLQKARADVEALVDPAQFANVNHLFKTIVTLDSPAYRQSIKSCFNDKTTDSSTSFASLSEDDKLEFLMNISSIPCSHEMFHISLISSLPWRKRCVLTFLPAFGILYSRHIYEKGIEILGGIPLNSLVENNGSLRDLFPRLALALMDAGISRMPYKNRQVLIVPLEADGIKDDENWSFAKEPSVTELAADCYLHMRLLSLVEHYLLFIASYPNNIASSTNSIRDLAKRSVMYYIRLRIPVSICIYYII